MKPFTYSYKNETVNASYESYMEDGYNRYRIFLDGLSFVIAPMGIRSPNGAIIWVQSVKPGETVLEHDFVQAVGEGMSLTI